MSATYNLFKNPGKGDNLHARQVNQYTVRIDALCEEISQISSFSSSDVKGMLEALKCLSPEIRGYRRTGRIGYVQCLPEMSVSAHRKTDHTSSGEVQQSSVPLLQRTEEGVALYESETGRRTKPSERIHGREAENEYIELHTAKQHDLYPRMPFHQWLLEVYRLERSPDIVG